MKKNIIFLFISCSYVLTCYGQTPIIFEADSDTQGFNIPGMFSSDRNAISNPQTGLWVFDEEKEGFYYWNGSSWERWLDNQSGIIDTDGDTQITVEKNTDEDKIRFYVAGTEVMRHDGRTLEMLDNGQSVFIGEEAGRNTNINIIGNNTFVGYHAGKFNVTGKDNSFLGAYAGEANTFGNQNSFLGAESGASNSSGSFNSFCGYRSGFSNLSGDSNSFYGSQSGEANNFGDENSFFGMQAGQSNTSGSGNSFFGYKAGSSNTTADNNSFFGFNSGKSNTIGTRNSFFGYNSGENNTTGSDLCFFGDKAGQANTTGSKNVFVGYNAGASNTQGSNSVAVGYEAGLGDTNMEKSVYIGAYAGKTNTPTQRTGNVFIGHKVGMNNTGNNLLMIDNTDTPDPLIYGDFNNNTVTIHGRLEIIPSEFTFYEAEDELVFENGTLNDTLTQKLQTAAGGIVVFGYDPVSGAFIGTESNHDFKIRTSGTNRMTIKNTGFVGIGTTSPSQRLHVNGNICATGTITTCSDIRYKQNISPIENALEKICAFRGVYYYWNDKAFPENEFTQDRQIGVIAQELEQVIPELVTTDEWDNKSVNYAGMSPLLMAGLKELSIKKDKLKTTITSTDSDQLMENLKSEIELIKEKLALLEN